MNRMKRTFAGILALVMVVAGIVVVPTQTDAAVAEDKIVYSTAYKIEDYWPTKTAPVESGYVFGGWYKSENENDYMTAEEAQAAVANGITAYAKFVPAQVLSVKTQNAEGTEAGSESANVRVMTSLDSKNYEKIGFDIWLANKNKLYKNDTDKTQLETTNIYDGLMVGTEERDANTIYGGVSRYVSVWQLGKIAGKHFGKIIYVRPYWVTKDGTKVEGLAKYVHVEDQYLGYTSIPINLLGGESVAAGVWNLTSDKAIELAGAEDVSFEPGRLLPDMAFNYDAANKTVKMAGNATTANKYSQEVTGEKETLLANIRIKTESITEDILFTVTPKSFADWGENLVTPKVWDVKYVK